MRRRSLQARKPVRHRDRCCRGWDPHSGGARKGLLLGDDRVAAETAAASAGCAALGARARARLADSRQNRAWLPAHRVVAISVRCCHYPEVHDPDVPYIAYLQRVDLEELAIRVQAFWEDPPDSEDEVLNRFLEVVAIDANDQSGNSSAYSVSTLTYPSHQTMWRVRRVQHDGNGTSIPGMNRETDLWEAPAHAVRVRGRLNDVGESVLYASVGDPVVAMIEARVPAGERFALIRYQTSRAVTLTSIAADAPPDWLPTELVGAHSSVTAFYRDVFAREFDGQNGLAYLLSNRLAKDWFDLPDAIVDGWSFPSIAYGRGVNAAFRPVRAHEVLEVAGVAYCEAVDSALLGRRIKAFGFSPGAEKDEPDFRWFPMGSPFQISRFPEFR